MCVGISFLLPWNNRILFLWAFNLWGRIMQQQGMVILCTTTSLTGFGPKACLPLVVTPKTAKAQVLKFSYVPSILNLHILKPLARPYTMVPLTQCTRWLHILTANSTTTSK
jgi:hypothetical protein